MPQVQMIQPDQGVETFQRGLQGFQQAIAQEQALALTLRELQIKSKTAQSDAEKQRAEKQLNVFKGITEISQAIKKGELSPEAAAVAFKQLAAYTGGDVNEMLGLSAEAGQTLEGFIKQLMPGEGEATESQNRASLIKERDSLTNLMSRIPKGNSSGPQQAGGGMMEGETPPQSNEGPLITGFNRGGINVAFPDAVARLKAIETEAQAAKEVDVQEKKFAAEQLRNAKTAVTAFTSLQRKFNAMIKERRDVIGMGADRIGGLFGIGASKLGILPASEGFRSQLIETAAAQMKLIAPAARPGSELLNIILENAMPKTFSTDPETIEQTITSMSNALSKAAVTNPDRFEGYSSKKFEESMRELFSKLANGTLEDITTEDVMGIAGEKTDIKVGETVTRGRFKVRRTE